MKTPIPTLAVAVAVAVAVLAGCGGAADPVARDPAPTSGDPSPHWPAKGCETHSQSAIDYVADAKGESTPDAALARYAPVGARVVHEQAKPHREARWLVVDEDNEILRAVTLFDGGHGWLVGGVEECAG